MKWEDYKEEFAWDGSLRDIYVLDTSISDWQILLDFLHSGAYEYSLIHQWRTATGAIGDRDIVLPSSATDITDIFEVISDDRPLLQVEVGSVVLCCHFFVTVEIEFDLDPREVKGEAEAEQIFDFMRQLGQLLNKKVILTPENGQQFVIFKFLPAIGQIQHTPVYPLYPL